MKQLKVLLFFCVVVLNIGTTLSTITGWIQNDANTGRSRNSEYGAYELQRDLIKVFDGYKAIPNSMVMPISALSFCGLGSGNNGEIVACIDNTGVFMSKYVKIPKEYGLIDVLPVIDDKLNYYSVRKNSTNGISFVLRSSVSDQTNQVLFDTKTNSNIHAMVITDYGLIIASGNFIVNVNRETGIGNWIINLNGIQNGCQFLYDTSQPSLYILYVLSNSGITAINTQNGAILGTTPSNTYINFAHQQFLTVGKDYLAIPHTYTITPASYISIYDKRNLQRGVIFTIELSGKYGKFLLDKCSNIISRGDTNSFFFTCSNSDSTFSAFRYDVSNTTVSLGYEINFSSLFGVPPKVCSKQIAAYGKSGFYGLACDVGLIGFHQDNIYVPRREIHIEVAQDTQVFGTLGRFALITSNNGKTQIEFVNTQ